jgi:hypothetical protein
VGAINFADELYQNYKEKILWLNHYEYAGFKALGLIKPEKPVIYEQLKNQAFSVSGQLKQNYITKKKSIFGL